MLFKYIRFPHESWGGIPTQELLLRIIRPSASSRKSFLLNGGFFRSSSKTIIVIVTNSWSHQILEDPQVRIHHPTKTKHFLPIEEKAATWKAMKHEKHPATTRVLPDDASVPLKEPSMCTSAEERTNVTHDASADGTRTIGCSAVASGGENTCDTFITRNVVKTNAC